MPLGVATAISVPLSYEAIGAGATVDNLLLEDGFSYLQEDGVSVFLLE